MLNKLRSKIVENSAQILRPSVQFLPLPIQNKVLLETLKYVFHEALEDGDFEFLQGNWLKITIIDLDLQWFISYQDDKLVVSKKQQVEQVSFSGKLNDLVLIAGRKEDPDTLFFQRRLSIEGDTELGLEIKNLMDSVDLDALPKPLTLLLNELADFVYKGLHTEKDQNGIANAY
ncbi:SCP2 domain-containing protein [Vibrio sp. TH_r3]|uniref:ubiquinone anaerobic biosynthesis accessory factor UbiT n=1 Tax=Vibrio sp. TH_r3 TaxID=3082084 RepID=UPI002952AB1D|nr:SCP2 domain-containing protein [Vibrio sp. TH_r3]MDV7106108.1 SCP2 domain-containing protein [Vibrio sp. TH_r3]